MLGLTRVLATVAVTGLAGCTGDLICPADIPGHAVQVSFYNAAGGALLTGPMRGAVHDRQFSDSLEVLESNDAGEPWLFGAVRGREGNYVLRAEREGFLPVEVAGIRVEQDGCYAIGEYVEAHMTPKGDQPGATK